MIKMFKAQLKSCFDFIREKLGKLGLRYTKFLIYERIIEAKIPTIRVKIPLTVRKASKDDINRLCVNKKERLKRLRKGDICFVAVAYNKIVGYLWVSFKKSTYMPPIEKNINLKNKEAYVYDGRVFLKFRRKNIGKSILKKVLQFLKSKNIKKAYVSAYADKKFMQKELKRFGFYPIKSITYLRVFMFKKYKEVAIR